MQGAGLGQKITQTGWDRVLYEAIREKEMQERVWKHEWGFGGNGLWGIRLQAEATRQRH